MVTLRSSLHRLVFVIALASLTVARPISLAAQTSTPVASPAALGYPELRVRVTDEGIEAPAEVPAGRYLYTTENATTTPVELGTLAAGLMPLPPGMTLEELNAVRTDETATYYYEVDWAGEPIPLRGQTASAIVDLTPGDWAIVLAEPFAPQPAVGLTVTEGIDPASASEPSANATVTMRDFVFEGIPDHLAAGQQIWKITNAGEQVHILFLLQYPEALSLEEAGRLFSLPPGATPPPDLDVDPSLIVAAGGMGPLAPGGTAWGVYDLAPGAYLAICFVPDPETGVPHFALGMTRVFVVEGVAATPAG